VKLSRVETAGAAATGVLLVAAYAAAEGSWRSVATLLLLLSAGITAMFTFPYPDHD
jgi:hypothetical protein